MWSPLPWNWIHRMCEATKIDPSKYKMDVYLNFSNVLFWLYFFREERGFLLLRVAPFTIHKVFLLNWVVSTSFLQKIRSIYTAKLIYITIDESNDLICGNSFLFLQFFVCNGHIFYFISISTSFRNVFQLIWIICEKKNISIHTVEIHNIQGVS